MGKQRWKRVISRYDSMVLGVMDTNIPPSVGLEEDLEGRKRTFCYQGMMLLVREWPVPCASLH